jgi:hypothetical protein
MVPLTAQERQARLLANESASTPFEEAEQETAEQLSELLA